MKTGQAIAAALAIAMAATLFNHSARADSAQPNVSVYQASFFAAARPNTVYDMLLRLPGFTFDDGGTARGFAGNAGNVLIDGERPTSKTDDLQSILVRIPASDVARIEIVRGGAPGIDMHGQTVVANIIRKDTTSTRIVTQIDENLFADGESVPELKAEFTRHSGGWLYEGAIRRFGNFDDSVGNGTHRVTSGAGVTTRDRAHTSGRGTGDALNGAVTLPLFGGQFKANLTLQESPFHSSIVYKSPGFLQAITDDSGSRNAELGLHWDGNVASGTHLEALILQRLGHSTDVNVSNDGALRQRFSSRSNTGESIARATVRYDLFKGLTLESGAEGAYNFLDGHSAYVANGVPMPLPSANARVEERRGEVFAKGTWKISKTLTFEAGARFEFSTISETGDTHKSRSFFYPKPRAVLSWTPDEATQVRLRVERVVGQLDFGNFVATGDLAATGVSAGNPDLEPDKRLRYALSYERHFWDKGAIVATLLHEQISDVVDLVPIFTPGGAFDAPGNIGSGTNDELDVELTLPLDRLGLPNGLIKTSAIWRVSQVRDPLTGQMRRISGQRQQAITITMTQDIDSLKSTWGVYFFDGWDESYYRIASYQHKRITPPYLEVYWEYKPTSQWSLRFEVDNAVPFILDKELDFYAGPRNTSPLTEAEHIAIQSQPRLYIRVRKTFG
jgi:hypothetical protein